MLKLRTGDIVVTKDVIIGTENKGKWPLFMIIGQIYETSVKNPFRFIVAPAHVEPGESNHILVDCNDICEINETMISIAVGSNVSFTQDYVAAKQKLIDSIDNDVIKGMVELSKSLEDSEMIVQMVDSIITYEREAGYRLRDIVYRNLDFETAQRVLNMLQYCELHKNYERYWIGKFEAMNLLARLKKIIKNNKGEE